MSKRRPADLRTGLSSGGLNRTRIPHVLIRDHADFRRLWLAQVVSQLGDKVHTLTVAWWVLELTASARHPQGDPSQVGYVMAVGALAATLFGPGLGWLADRFPRRSVMVAADLGRAVLCVVLALAANSGQGSLPLLYGVVFLVSVLTLMFNPATHAILGCLVKPEEMQEALSLQQITRDLCQLVGSALGGALVAAVGVQLGFALDAGSFLLSALFLLAIRQRERTAAEREAEAPSGGVAFLKEHPTILGLLAIFALANVFLAPMFVLIPSVSKIVLQGTAATLGLLEGALALGSILTTAVLLRRNFARRWPSLCGAVVVNGLAFAAMAWSQTVVPMALALAVVGGCLATVNVQFICLLQLLTPESLKGRVFAVVESIATAAFPLAFFFSGLAVATFSIPHIFLGCGLGLLLVGLALPLIPGVRQV